MAGLGGYPGLQRSPPFARIFDRIFCRPHERAHRHRRKPIMRIGNIQRGRVQG